MASKLKPGLYVAKPAEWGVGKSSGGAVEVSIRFELLAFVVPGTKEEVGLSSQSFITGYFYPVKKDGTINDNPYKALMTSLGWDGASFKSFKAMDHSQSLVKISVGASKPKNNGEVYDEVKFLNPIDYVGGGGPLKTADDDTLDGMDESLGSAMRAFSSGIEVRKPAGRPAPVRAVEPATANPLQPAWDAFCGLVAPLVDEAERTKLWDSFLAENAGKSAGELLDAAKHYVVPESAKLDLPF